MSEITNTLTSTISVEFTNSPINWVNNKTQLNATNLNTLSSSIEDNRKIIKNIADNINNIVAGANSIFERSVGLKNPSIPTAEIFNDYESNVATGDYSHVEGQGNTSSTNHQHVQGRFNVADVAGDFAHIIGNGNNEENRSNAHTVDWNGNAWYAGEITSSDVKLPVYDKQGNPSGHISLRDLSDSVNELESSINPELLESLENISNETIEKLDNFSEIAATVDNHTDTIEEFKFALSEQDTNLVALMEEQDTLKNNLNRLLVDNEVAHLSISLQLEQLALAVNNPYEDNTTLKDKVTALEDGILQRLEELETKINSLISAGESAPDTTNVNTDYYIQYEE